MSGAGSELIPPSLVQQHEKRARGDAFWTSFPFIRLVCSVAHTGLRSMRIFDLRFRLVAREFSEQEAEPQKAEPQKVKTQKVTQRAKAQKVKAETIEMIY
jgi:hypothetical protein